MTPAGSYILTDAERTRLGSAERLRISGTAGIAELVSMLDDQSWVVRRSVVDALGSIGPVAAPALADVLLNKRDNEARIAAAVDALVRIESSIDKEIAKLVASPDPAIVADAAQVLGRRREVSAVPTLVSLSKHADDNVAVASIEALGRIGGRAAVEALVESTRSGNFFRTFPAIDVLGRSGDPRAVEPLVQLLQNPNYRPEAARALGRTGERTAVKPLSDLMRSGSAASLRLAALALWNLRERFQEKSGGDLGLIDDAIRAHVGSDLVRKLVQILPTVDANEAVVVCNLLGAIGSAEASPQLTTILNGPPAVAAAAAEALKKIGKDADASLATAIREGESAQRKALLPLVTRFSSAVDVARCLQDRDPDVRALACETLARIGNPVVVAEIFPLLSETNLRVVHAATAAIQALGSRQARELAIVASTAKSPVVRRSALRILAYFGDAEALQPMLKGLGDEDSRVCEAALQGLPYLESPLALEALYEATKNSSARVRSLAMRSLGQTPKKAERTIAILLKGLSDPDPWVRYYACQSLGRVQYAEAATELGNMLHDEAGQVRVSAVEALSHIDSPAAQRILRTAASSNEMEVKRAAIVGLGIAHRTEDLPIVLAAATDADTATRLIALSSLISFNSPQVVAAIGSAASDSDEQVRTTAIGFLAARPEHESTEILVDLLGKGDEKTKDLAKAALLVPAPGRVSGILEVLETAGDDLASELVSVLARIDRPESRMGLMSAMKLENVAARKAAASGLAARRDPEMISILSRAASTDPDADVRHICSILIRE